MDKDVGPASSAGATPLEQVKQSVHSDLQYVSIQVEGATYGGWYRVLADGQMELLALANMHCERRTENTPIEQARGMLADFIRVARPQLKANRATSTDAPSESAGQDRHRCTPGTLGHLLYANQAKTLVAEQDWVGLLQSIAAGDQLALRELYERAHRFVFILIVRLTNSREIAQQLTLDVFFDVWRRARQYDAAAGSVVGWVMNQARSRTIDHLVFEQGKAKEALRPVIGSFVYWPSDQLRPSEALWGSLAQRIAAQTGGQPVPSTASQWTEPEWEEVASGISCKLLATDAAKERVSMLVRLAPGVEYPPHTHAGVEELHLLDGELLIDDRKLHPGDYNRAEPGSADKRVWTETGCMCVLVTSTQDAIG